MSIDFSIERIELNGGASISLNPTDTVLIVGPNNAGKSALLREVRRKLVGHRKCVVLRDLQVRKAGTADDVHSWLESHVSAREDDQGMPQYRWYNLDHEPHSDPQRVRDVTGSAQLEHKNLATEWSEDNRNGLLGTFLGSVLCILADTEARLRVGNAPRSFDVLNAAPFHPIHTLLIDDELEARVSQIFRHAFGVDLTLNRGAGTTLPMHVGPRPEMRQGEDRVSKDYVRRLAQLPLLHEQGDGMRSFVGCLLHATTSPALVVMIDEPEAFLHPRQARLIGRVLANELKGRQALVATHSSSLLRGVLAQNQENLRVVRLTREGERNFVRELAPDRVHQVLADPFLRFSNVLDALFHEEVVLCEDESDCQFFSALCDALIQHGKHRDPDVLFVGCGGKDRIHVAAAALRELGLRPKAIVDFDGLRDGAALRALVTAFGGEWTELEPSHRRFEAAIANMSKPMQVSQARSKIGELLAAFDGGSALDRTTIKAIRSILKVATPWDRLKHSGTSAVPSGDAQRHLGDLIERLGRIGIYVVPSGEVESFVRSVGNHGSKWVASVLESHDLVHALELQSARSFLRRVLEIEISEIE